MSLQKQWLTRNFVIICRLLEIIGINALTVSFRPNWRTVYTVSMIVLALVQILYLLWCERSNLLSFMIVLPNWLFTFQGLFKLMMNLRKSDKLLSLRSKLSEIQQMLSETESNGPIICDVLKMSYYLQTIIFMFYLSSVVLVLLMPFVLWLVLGKKMLMFVFFVPGTDASTNEGFLLCMAMHAVMMPAAFFGYTGHECMFLGFVMPVAAYVDAFANEIQELNSNLTPPKPDQTVIRNQLNRIVKFHQLLNEYKAMLEDLYNVLILNKVGLNYLGIIITIVVILKSNDRMAYIFFALMFEQLTQVCLMGTIITVKVRPLGC